MFGTSELIIIIVLFICTIIYGIWKDKKQTKEADELERTIRQQRKEYQEEQKHRYSKQMASFSEQFGPCSHDICLDEDNEYDIEGHLMFFEEGRMCVLKGKQYSFEKIVSFEVKDQASTVYSFTSETKTPTGNMAKRAFIGSLVDPSIGLITALTSKKRDNCGRLCRRITRLHPLSHGGFNF